MEAGSVESRGQRLVWQCPVAGGWGGTAEDPAVVIEEVGSAIDKEVGVAMVEGTGGR